LPGDDISYVSQYSEIRFADVCDVNGLKDAINDVDLVIHLAGIVDITRQNRSLTRRVNIDGTRNVAEICRERRIKMIYCSTVHAIPPLPEPQVMTEAEVLDFHPDKVKGTYGKTKAEATRLVLEMSKQGLDVMILFPSGIIGPYERKISNIGQLILDFLCGGLWVYFDGKYNFVDIRDVVSGICGMIDNWSSGECYILSGHEVTVEAMLSEIAKASGKKMIRAKLPYWFVYAASYLLEIYSLSLGKKPLFTPYSIQTLRSNCHFSSQKAQEHLGFSPRPYSDSLSEMTLWIMEHFAVESEGKYNPGAFRE
jgi:dihydroflavonol-4-reductase